MKLKVTPLIKNIIIAAVVALLLFFAYRFFSGRSQEPQQLVRGGVFGTDADATAVAAESEILSLLLELRSIDLSGDVFDLSEFKSLVNFDVTIESQPIGRINPFAPVGGTSSEGTPTEPE